MVPSENLELVAPDAPDPEDLNAGIAASLHSAAAPNAEVSVALLNSKGRDEQRVAGEEEIAGEQIYLDAYGKYPKEWLDALAEGPLLEACRRELEQAGHSSILLDSGAKVFVQLLDWDMALGARKS